MNYPTCYWYYPKLPAWQITITKPIWCCGKGLHSGKNSRVRLLPAEPNTGIVFHAMNGEDILGTVPAEVQYAVNGQFRTVLASNGIVIETTEHLLAAVRASGITNLVIQVWGNEIPIHNGNAQDWRFLILASGTTEQTVTARTIHVTKPVRVGTHDAWCQLTPAATSQWSYDLHYDHPLLSRQSSRFDLDRDDFDSELAAAKTFGFLEDWEYLLTNGLGLGADCSNTLVFDQKILLNEGGMTWPNEPARHKLVDAMGDLSLAGAAIMGHFHGHRSGHALNHQILTKLLSDKSAWHWG